MPPTANRRSERKRAASSRKVEAVESSPTRPPKKRKTAATIRTTPKQEIEETPVEVQDEDSSDMADTVLPGAAADEIIPFLREAAYTVVASLEYANTASHENEYENVQAFAKVAGKDWTYYVREPSIYIGRSPDGGSKPNLEHGSLSSPALQAEDITVAQIDLGPSKLVSRIHARCYFENRDDKWYIDVNGRNGVRVNDILLRRGQKTPLSSGDVIEVAGTEMVFVSASVTAVVHEKYRARLDDPIKEEEASHNMSSTHSHPELPTHDNTAQLLAQAFTLGPPYVNGQPMIAPAPPNFLRNSTPSKPFASAPQPSMKSPYGQTVLLESSEKMDYSSDAMKDVKPPCSYSTLIGQAILSVPEEKMPLSSIYDWIKKHFSYYRHMDGGWQNSIRHNLSLNQSFKKIAREANEPGKGGMWYIAPDKKEQIKADGLKMTSRGGARRSSNPNSPIPKKSPKKNSPPNLVDSPTVVYKTSPVDRTPLSTAYPPAAQESYTPSRGPRISALGHSNSQVLPQLSDDASPLPSRPYLSRNAAAAGSPQPLSSSAYFNDDQQSGYNLFTPAPQRHEPKMIAPSTAKLPSQYLPQSSPAPFWKIERHPGSTPGQYPESSPLKAIATVNEVPPQSSSPPPVVASGSPTRARGVPLEATVNGAKQVHSLEINVSRVGMEDDEDDDGQLDLMGQFPKIGDRRISSAAH
ncbi:transcription factor [Xylographa parallela]|nr:transcription factor [Xylographa parallela]